MAKKNVSIHQIQWDDDKVKNIWDYYSNTPAYEDLYFTKLVGNDLVKYVLKTQKLQSKKILDYGCGVGYLFQSLDAIVGSFDYYGLDFSKKKSINKITERFGGNEKFKQAGILDDILLMVDNIGKFDVIFLIEVIEHLNDSYLEKTMTNIKKLLSDDGILVITTPNNENLDLEKNFCPECGCIYHKWQHERSWSEENLNTYLQKNGFESLHINTINFFGNINFLRKIWRNLKNIIKKEKLSTLIYIGKMTNCEN